MPRPPILSQQDFHALTLEICQKLDGLAFAQIDHLLRTVSTVCSTGAAFSTASPLFREQVRRGVELYAKDIAESKH